MIDYNTGINEIIYHFDDKKNKKLKTDVFLRLCKKVGEENTELNTMIKDTYILLNELRNDETAKNKAYLKSFSNLRSKVKKDLDYTAKGSLQEEFTALGIALGVAFGSVFVTVNPVFISIGLPIGLAIGVSIGKKKESEAEAAGNTY